eukprot:TRINITY_DN6061_c0_g3_i1.p1 TRINITY_DN6061_c0_g3~~TRINITY_DN6061_c0_g3_i1.p1  ORF type:complete len:180 (-),score=42.26 TRINITY_DN6061_c0_g3_i1:15-491(-)
MASQMKKGPDSKRQRAVVPDDVAVPKAEAPASDADAPVDAEAEGDAAAQPQPKRTRAAIGLSPHSQQGIVALEIPETWGQGNRVRIRWKVGDKWFHLYVSSSQAPSWSVASSVVQQLTHYINSTQALSVHEVYRRRDDLCPEQTPTAAARKSAAKQWQ